MKDRKRLARIISIKERARAARRSELTLADLALAEARDHAERANAMLDTAIERLTRSGDISAADLAAHAAMVAEADRSVSEAHTEVARFSEIRDVRATAVRRAAGEVAVLQRVDDKLATDERREGRRTEQRESDDLSQRKAG